MTEVLFDKLSRGLELLVLGPNDDFQRGRLNLRQIIYKAGDFILLGTGISSGKEHRFPLSQVHEIIDLETGEHVNILEFRAELEAHPRSQ